MCAASSSLFTREYVACAVSRHPDASSDSLTKFLPKFAEATLVVFCPLEPPAGEDTSSSSSQSSSDDTSDLSSQNGSSDEEGQAGQNHAGGDGDQPGQLPEHDAYSDSNVSIESKTVRAARSLHVAIDDQIDSESICVLAVASRECIIDTLASALYHRHAIGALRAPLVGLTFAEDSHCLQVIIAWLGDVMVEGLPQVHVLHAPFDSSTVHESIFDISNPESAMSLALFLFTLGEQITSELFAAYYADYSVPEDFLWRLDQVLVQDAPEVDLSLGDSIPAWLRGLKMQSYQNGEPVMDPEKLAPSSSALRRWNRRSPPVMPPEIVGDPTSIWLYDRGCRSSSAILLGYQRRYDSVMDNETNPRVVSMYREFLASYNLYDEATQPRWPREWTCVDDMPPVSKCIAPFQADLLTDILEGQGKKYTMPTLDLVDDMLAIVIDALADILNVVAQIVASDRPAGLPRQAVRSKFDVLNDRILFSTPLSDEMPTVVPLLDQMVNMPRNDLADFMRRPSVIHNKYLNTSMLGKRAVPLHIEGLMGGYVEDVHASHLRLSIFLLGEEHDRLIATPASREEQEYLDKHTEQLAAWGSAVEHTAQRALDDPRQLSCHSISGVVIPSVVPAHLRQRAAECSLVVHADPSESLFLPLLVVQYQRDPATRNNTMFSRLQMHLTAAAKFLAALGILDFPVFGVYVRSTLGVIVCAWKSSTVPAEDADIPMVHIFEWRCQKCDLATPLGAFNYATFLAYIRCVRAKELVRRFGEDERRVFLEKLERGDDSLEWTSEHQNEMASPGA
ncbi:hypothetical protein BV25DRAFT_1922523 [Artomyces pyxidatus]|uniref:Uncharacterized protein n=1 Tax=Artomyces pyxidatus TaxID=48021 RepID=A0ACB8SEF0_9AGAM|nr:hypothetical protein BV25DRAFT_1922523 [Artomyces pyxidatus]